MSMLSKNFTRGEFACKGTGCCGGSSPVERDLVDVLQKIRNRIQEPLYVTSGFRCRTHNATIPGASENSQHTLACAADVWAANTSPQEIGRIADEILGNGNGGVAVYSGFTHVDVRPPPLWRHGL